MTLHGFRLYAFVFLINGFNIWASSFFTALNNGVVSGMICIPSNFVVPDWVYYAAATCAWIKWNLDGSCCGGDVDFNCYDLFFTE